MQSFLRVEPLGGDTCEVVAKAKVKCGRCDAMILPTTAERIGGMGTPFFRRPFLHTPAAIAYAPTEGRV